MYRKDRRVVIGVRLAFVAVLLSGCTASASSEDQPPTPGQNERMQAHAPERVGGYSIADSIVFPDARLGTMYRYEGSTDMTPDVYVYPWTPDRSLDGEVAAFLSALQVRERQGRYLEHEVMHQELWSPDRRLEGREVVVRLLTADQDRLHSHFYVLGVGESLLKVRVTGVEGEVPSEDVRAFVAELAEEGVRAVAGSEWKAARDRTPPPGVELAMRSLPRSGGGTRTEESITRG